MPALLVANDGGHLMQLHSLASRLEWQNRIWMTVRTAQSESLLRGEQVIWMRPARTRDLRAVVTNTWLARNVLRGIRLEAAVSTGASLALSVLPVARMFGIPCFYIESATRVAGPSVSGRLLGAVPGIRRFTQHEEWANRRWSYRGSVLDEYESVVNPGSEGDISPRKIVVTLGTSESYGFRRLLDRLKEILPADAEVLWQTGSTDVSGLGICGRVAVPASELLESMRACDVVIAHAGTGSALSALQSGKVPLLVPRRPEHAEHVDDHQLQIAGSLASRKLAIVREVEDLDRSSLAVAARHSVVRVLQPPTLHLTS